MTDEREPVTNLTPLPNLDGYETWKNVVTPMIYSAFAVSPAAFKPPLTIQRIIDAFETLDALATYVNQHANNDDQP